MKIYIRLLVWPIWSCPASIWNYYLDKDFCKMNLLKVPNMCCGFHKMSCLPKESVHPSCNNNCFNFTLFTCWAWVNSIARMFCHWERLSCKSWLKKKKTDYLDHRLESAAIDSMWVSNFGWKSHQAYVIGLYCWDFSSRKVLHKRSMIIIIHTRDNIFNVVRPNCLHPRTREINLL